MKLNVNLKNENYKVPYSYNSYDLNLKEKINFLVLSSLILMIIAFIFYHNFIISFIISSLAYPGLHFYSNYLAEKRRNALKEQFRDALYSISSSIIAGRQMAEALYEAKENMIIIYNDKAIIVLELSNMVKRIFESRESEEDLLKDFAKRSHLEDIVSFVDTYFTCRLTGGDLVKVVTKTSEILLDKLTIEKEIYTITSQKRFEAKILTAIPFVVILFLQIASPDYLSIMYEHILGRLLMTVAIIGISLSYYISIKLTNIEV